MELVKNPLFARLFAHSRDPLFARYQQAADLAWPHLMGGCHVQRQTEAAISQHLTH
jgi:hypothetical protein